MVAASIFQNNTLVRAQTFRQDGKTRVFMKDSVKKAKLVNHILETSIVPSIPYNDKQCLCWTAYDYSENEFVEKVYVVIGKRFQRD